MYAVGGDLRVNTQHIVAGQCAILEIIVAGHGAHAWICQIAIEKVEALAAVVRNVRRRAVISIDMVCRRFANDAVGSRFSIHPIGAGSGVQVIVAVAAKHVVCAAARHKANRCRRRQT